MPKIQGKPLKEENPSSQTNGGKYLQEGKHEGDQCE